MDSIIKHSEEYFPIYVDFGIDLVQGETISSYSITCINRETGANTKSSIVNSDSMSSPLVSIKIKNGIDQEVHIVTILAITSLGNKYRRVIFVYVIDDPAQDSFEKSVAEILVAMVDFVNELEPSDTIASATVVATDNITGFVVTLEIIVSNTVVTPKVYFKVQAGTAKTDYNIVVKGTSASGYKYVRTILMRVRDI
jgi:hypothetical protein